MSFAVTLNGGQMEWAGDSLSTVFAQRSNLLSPSFLRMLWDVRRFNAEAVEFLARVDNASSKLTIGEFLERGGYSQSFRDLYLLPMTAAIWSTPAVGMLAFPAVTLLRFYHNHGFTNLSGRPQWLTVTNGSREYVRKVTAGLPDVRVSCAVKSVRRIDGGRSIVTDITGRQEIYDEVVFACHGDQVLALLQDPTDEERTVLGKIQYKKNVAVVHRDPSVCSFRSSLVVDTHHV